MIIGVSGSFTLDPTRSQNSLPYAVQDPTSLAGWSSITYEHDTDLGNSTHAGTSSTTRAHQHAKAPPRRWERSRIKLAWVPLLQTILSSSNIMAQNLRRNVALVCVGRRAAEKILRERGVSASESVANRE